MTLKGKATGFPRKSQMARRLHDTGSRPWRLHGRAPIANLDTSTAHDARKPTDADRFVGQRLRQGRREQGMTQEALAALLGVTFQQIQKYEAGNSRMSAGRLLEIAMALGRPVGWFYEPFEIAGPDDTGGGRDLQAHDLKRDARRLVEEIVDLKSLQAAVYVLNALAHPH